MKYTSLFCIGLCFSIISYAQNTNSTSGQNKLKVSLTKDSLSVTYNNQHLPINNVQALDSLMKKIPDLENLNVEFLSEAADQEKRQSISRILGQCHCPTMSRSKVTY